MSRLEILGGLTLYALTLLGAFFAGRLTVPPVTDQDAATTISSLEAQLEESQREASDLHARLAHVTEAEMDRLAELAQEAQ